MNKKSTFSVIALVLGAWMVLGIFFGTFADDINFITFIRDLLAVPYFIYNGIPAAIIVVICAVAGIKRDEPRKMLAIVSLIPLIISAIRYFWL